ncbi:MAG: hypothetical protein ACRC5C_15210, partial [Bacilli bacterium]
LPEQIDVVLLDGPHGNGRSLAFPMLYDRLAPNALVLVDDHTHYPFEADLFALFHYETLYKNTVDTQHWALFRLLGKRS